MHTIYYFMNFLKKYLLNLDRRATILNTNNIRSQLVTDKNARYLDLGCDDGKKTLLFADKMGTKNIYGIELIQKHANIAKKNGIKVYIGNLDKKWPVKNNHFDVITANQVIEHVADIDCFVSELKRVLKKGGYAVISTENGSSWHNIFASIMGWQTFSLACMSTMQWCIGNPLSLHVNEENPFGWTHKTIFNYQGLKELFEVYGFTVESYFGSGYHPLPPVLGSYDVRHAHFISIKIKKLF